MDNKKLKILEDLDDLILIYKDLIEELRDDANCKMHDYRELVGRAEQVEEAIEHLKTLKTKI